MKRVSLALASAAFCAVAGACAVLVEPAGEARAHAGGAADDDPGRERGLGDGRTLLAASDFSFVGSYLFKADVQAAYGMGLTCRRVKGQLRFLTFSYSGKADAQLIEFALPEKPGDKITVLTDKWEDIWSPAGRPKVGSGDQYGLWWEDRGDEEGRLWTTRCTDYPGDPQPANSDTGTNNPFAVAVRNLRPGGQAANVKGDYGFSKVGQRAIYGGVLPIPKWFRDKYGVEEPYAIGWGGYTSRVAQGLVPSLGLMVLAAPDVTTYEAGTVVPPKDFQILADHRSGTTHAKDWYAAGKPTDFDRGQRNADVINYFDGGDPRKIPQTPPGDPPAAGAQWLSPAPDKFGRFVWGDSFYNTGCWIDGPHKDGFIVVGTFAKGKAYYLGSTLHNEGRHAELQIFDPNDFGRVVKGKLAPWNVQPADSKLLTPDLAPLGLLFETSGNGTFGGVAGAAFDSDTATLYLWCPLVDGKATNGCLLVAYKVKY